MTDLISTPYPLWFCLLVSGICYAAGIYCQSWWTLDAAELMYIIQDLEDYDETEARHYLLDQIQMHRREGSILIADSLQLLVDKL